MKKYFFVLSILFCALFARDVFAADFSIVSNKTQVLEGDTFESVVYVDSSGISVNSVEGIISFPSDLLSVVSVNNSASIFSLWVEQPQYSNTAGTISFSGGVPNPGFNGAQGSVLKILFKAKKSGNATINFTKSSIYANDGKGSNVFSKAYPSNVLIDVVGFVPYIPVPDAVQAVVVSPPPKPLVRSEDIPDPERWYNKNGTTFSWDLPSGVTSVQLFLGSKPDTVPSVTYSPPIKTKTIGDLTDGIWYFHSRFRNAGGWGVIDHRQIKVDMTKPESLDVASIVDNSGKVNLNINAKDNLSGIEKYEIYNGEKIIKTVEAQKDNSTILELDNIGAGEFDIKVIALDYAGNSIEKNVHISIPKTMPPSVKTDTDKIDINEEVTIIGNTYPDTNVILFVDNADFSKQIAVTSDDDGLFKTNIKMNESGEYQIVAKFADCTKDKCLQSEKVFVFVNQSYLNKIYSIIDSLNLKGNFYIILGIIFILIIFIILIFLLTRKKKKYYTYDDVRRTDEGVQKIFGVLREDLNRHQMIIQQKELLRKLEEKEKEVVEDLGRDLQEAEKYFTKRIEQLERKDL